MSVLAQVVQVDVLPYTDYLLTLPSTATRSGTPITDANGLCKAVVTAQSAGGATVSAGSMTYNGGVTPPQWEYTVTGDGIIPGRALFARLQVCNLPGAIVYYTAAVRLRPIY